MSTVTVTVPKSIVGELETICAARADEIRNDMHGIGHAQTFDSQAQRLVDMLAARDAFAEASGPF